MLRAAGIGRRDRVAVVLPNGPEMDSDSSHGGGGERGLRSAEPGLRELRSSTDILLICGLVH